MEASGNETQDVEFNLFCKNVLRETPETINHWLTCDDPFRRSLAEIVKNYAERCE